ncbi:hypothetical protein J6590_042070 [Homalodisca vitripennis]|nr:hypothetical protein J6590_042070 [Homalodisca vitripennis]
MSCWRRLKYCRANGQGGFYTPRILAPDRRSTRRDVGTCSVQHVGRVHVHVACLNTAIVHGD